MISSVKVWKADVTKEKMEKVVFFFFLSILFGIGEKRFARGKIKRWLFILQG